MAGVTESCTVCGNPFEVQFRYQMEELDGGFAFFCSQECQGKHVRGEEAGGVTCDACRKHFTVELVSQVVRVKSVRKYACSQACRTQLLAEAEGARLGDLAVREAEPAAPAKPAQEERPAVAPVVRIAPSVPAHVPSNLGSNIAPPASASVPASVPTSGRPALHAPARLAIFNHKGGTGKTTTSVSIAAGLAARGLRVLLVDTDSQGNVGVSLDVKAERSLYHVLVMGLNARDAAITVRPNLDVIVSNETLAAAELYLAGRQNRDRVLATRLGAVASFHDVLILDCSPSLSLMNQNALVFAEGILVPVACDFLSLVGVRQVIKTVKSVNSLLHHPVQIYGVLPTFYDGRARICRDAIDTMRDHFGERVLPPIRATIKIKEAPAQGRTIYEYAPESNAAADYHRAVDYLIGGPCAAARIEETDADEAERCSAIA
jgi:chromosome partitioning protein